MKLPARMQAGSLVAIVGMAGAGLLILHNKPATIFVLLQAGGWSLVSIAAIHVLPMLCNARDWQILLQKQDRQGFLAMLKLVWLRESINGLLPVARIGGEVVAFRVLRGRGVSAPGALGSLVVDTQLTLISQLLFTLAGIAFLLTLPATGAALLAGKLLWGTLCLAPVLVIFALFQHAGPFEKVIRLLNKATSGKLAAMVGGSARIDGTIKNLWRQPALVLRFLFWWQPLQFLLTALEIWVALYLLGRSVPFMDAVVMEALIQALSSAAFFIPGAIGIQEGGFVMVGGAFGIEPSMCLALAGSRRIRDLLVFLPGLVAWQFTERNSFRRADGLHAER